MWRFYRATAGPWKPGRAETRYNPSMIGFSSLFRLDGRVAFVAGAASGIGLAAAQGLAAAGELVVCADVDAAGAGRGAAGIV